MAGGTPEAPAWLMPPVVPNQLPSGPEPAWPHMQDSYGGVAIGGGFTVRPLPGSEPLRGPDGK